VSCRPQGAIVLMKASFIPVWISDDYAFELSKVDPCTRSRVSQMRTLIPAGNTSIPTERRDLSTELEPSPPLVGRYPKTTEASSMRLLLRNGQRLRVLFDRVGNRPSKVQAVKGGSAGAVLHEVGSRKRVHSCEV
jgi:hypothetical protein